MEIISGLFDNMVVQRNKRNICDQTITGTIEDKEYSGKLFASVYQAGKTLDGFKNIPIGIVSEGILNGKLKGLKTGGPYKIKLSIFSDKKVIDALIVKNILVGDVWMLAGQSNMEGIGDLESGKLSPVQEVRAFFMDDRWDIAADSIHELHKAKAEVHYNPNHYDKAGNGKGIGPGVSFGQEMHQKTGVPQGLIASAHGGTTMNQWSPDLKNEGDKSFYGAMLNRFIKNGSKIAGILWYQGCSDASKESALKYTKKTKDFIKAVRSDMDSPSLPFVMVQIGRVVSNGHDPEAWTSVREQQRLIAETIPNTCLVPVIDLELDDGIHISGSSQIKLGKRIAYAMGALCNGGSKGKKPISVKSIKVTKDKFTSKCNVTITFDNVVGSLVSQGRPHGFSLFRNGKNTEEVFRQAIEGNKVTLKTEVITSGENFKRDIYYGYGLNTYCNITDEAERSLPAFGPLPLPKITK